MPGTLDPISAGVASALKTLRARSGLRGDRLTDAGPALDTLTGLAIFKQFRGATVAEGVIQAVRAAASTLEPTYSIVVDASLALELAGNAVPGLYTSDLGGRRAALLENWERLHELRSVPSSGPPPTMRALRLDLETEALSALALALTDAERSRAASLSSSALSTDTAPAPRLVRSPVPLLTEEFRRIASALRSALASDPRGKGWRHDLRPGPNPPTPLATSFGIKAMLLIEGHLAVDLIPVANYLAQAEEDGGYAARTQGEPRPEGTAAVVSALHCIDGTATFDAHLDSIEASLGDVERSRPLILSTVLEASAQLGSRPELTGTLVGDLLAARRDFGSGSGALLLWPQKAEDGLVAPRPSVPHTARAVRALAATLDSALADTFFVDAALRAAAEKAVEEAAVWLAGQQNLEGTSELIERQTEHGVEQLYVRHYTAAWVVKALVSVGLPASHAAVSAGLARIWADYQPDVCLWRWSNGDMPVWMTLDSLEALHLAALSSTVTLRAP
jgi:hypothetical protein